MPLTQKLIVVLLLGLMAGTMGAIYWKLRAKPETVTESTIIEKEAPPLPPAIYLPTYCQPVEGESTLIEVTVGGKKHRVYDVIALDVSRLPTLPKDAFVGEDLIRILNALGGSETSAVEWLRELSLINDRFSHNVKGLATQLRGAVPEKADELLKEIEKLAKQLDVIRTQIDLQQLEATIKARDEMLTALDGMLKTIQGFPAVAERPLGLKRGELLVRFRLIPEDEYSQERSFYMMEAKAWSDLFRVFAQSHPETLAEDTIWTKNPPGKKPVFHVTLQEAYWFARWMGGELPSVKQWDTAAGYYLPGEDRDDLTGPYKLPEKNGDPLLVAVGGEESVQAVDDPTHDISPLKIKHMAGNGEEFTRSLVGGLRELDYSPEFLRSFLPTVYLQGQSYDVQDAHPLSYEDMRTRRLIPEGWPTGSQASESTSFRVVLEIPTR
jgi:hypothetical protein